MYVNPFFESTKNNRSKKNTKVGYGEEPVANAWTGKIKKKKRPSLRTEERRPRDTINGGVKK